MTHRKDHDDEDITYDAARRPLPVTDAVRAQVAELHAQGLGRNAIAREVGVSTASVSKIARERGLVFDRSATELALKARLIDLADARTELAKSFLVRAQEALDAMDEAVVLGQFGGKDNVWNETLLDEPTIEGRNTLMRTAATASRSFQELTRVDQASISTSEAVGMVGGLAAALGLAAEQLAKAGELPDPTETPGQQA